MINTNMSHRNRWSCFLAGFVFAGGASDIGQTDPHFDTQSKNFNSTSCFQAITQPVALASVFFMHCSAVYHLFRILDPVNAIINFFCLEIKLL